MEREHYRTEYCILIFEPITLTFLLTLIVHSDMDQSNISHCLLFLNHIVKIWVKGVKRKNPRHLVDSLLRMPIQIRPFHGKVLPDRSS